MATVIPVEQLFNPRASVRLEDLEGPLRNVLTKTGLFAVRRNHPGTPVRRLDAINELLKRPPVLNTIQLTPGFWVCVRRALEDQAIVAVGKIFGHRGANPTNIDRFFEVLRSSGGGWRAVWDEFRNWILQGVMDSACTPRSNRGR
jgi:hypothetical protein